MRKSKQEMIDSILNEMIIRQGVTEVSPGSVARTFVEIMTEQFYGFYEELDAMMLMGYVTTATGTYLDLIGALLNCTRNVGESDGDYRTRITNQVYVVQGANIIALRLRVLQVTGVADVEFVRFTNGAGSFTCYIIPEEYPISNSLIDAAQAVVDEVQGYGIYGLVKASTAIPVDMSIQLFFNASTTNAERQTLRQNVSSSVEKYVNGLGRGEGIVINEIIQQVMDTSPKITDMQIFQLNVNDVSQYIRNLYPKAQEQYFLRRISIT